MPRTNIPEPRLRELREAGRIVAAKEAFPDPTMISACCRVLDERGEEWAASVLGRDISARSRLVVTRPALGSGEDYALVAADTDEDAYALREMLDG